MTNPTNPLTDAAQAAAQAALLAGGIHDNAQSTDHSQADQHVER